MDAKVTILNPWDSQGNQITDGLGIYHCLRGCGGGGYQQGYVLQHLEQIQMDERVKKRDYFPVESFGHDERSTQFSRGGCCDTLTSSDHKQPIIIAYEKQQEVLVFKERAGCAGGGQRDIDHKKQVLHIIDSAR